MFEGDDELMNDFVVESTEGLAEIESDLLALEHGGAAVDSDLINKVFRAIHSIKGAAGFLALASIEKLAHNMEHVLSQVRAGELVPTSTITDRLLKGADLLQRMLADIHNSNTYDVTNHVNALMEAAGGQSHGGHEVVPEVLVEEPSDMRDTGRHNSLSTSSEQIAEYIANGDRVYRYTFTADHPMAEKVHELAARLRDTGTILVDQFESVAPFQAIHATILNPQQVGMFFEIGEKYIEELAASDGTSGVSAEQHVEETVEQNSAVIQEPVKAMAVEASPLETLEVASKNLTKAMKNSDSDSSSGEHDAGDHKKADANIRVSVAVLDRLMNLAGELVLSRNQLLQTSEHLESRALDQIANRINMVTSELQEAIMQTRMQPIGNIFTKFTRIVRDLAKTLGKEANLIIEGKEVELDKSIIETIGDPLTHLVRNSMDHGLETPEKRLQAGKNEIGTVRLKALHQEGKVLLVVEDDGAGIDPSRIRSKAVEKKLITPEVAATMSDKDAIQLIFAPGFSTAETLSAVSGRGVGMDVVKTNIERIGGQVEISSRLGEGTTITVKLPLTLAIIPSLITGSGGQRFAIPQGNIRELVRVRPDERAERISQVNRSDVLRLRGDLLPLVRLNSLIRHERDTSNENTNIVVMESGSLRYGLVVDRLFDSEEIVVKPLGKHFKSIHYLAGATVLGDGCVAMILDAGGLARRCDLQATNSETSQEKEREVTEGSETISSLLITNHPNEYFAIPMTVVSRIERIQSNQIDTVAGREVLQYRGSTLTLLSLENCIKAKSRPQQDRLYVVVFKHGQREIGLVAPEVFDIRSLPTEIDTVAFREPGVMGSLVLDNHTIRMLDVFDLGNTQHAIGKAATFLTDAPAVITSHKHRILFAEDSAFFRNKVKKFLEAEGWEVTGCEDGQEAWEMLCQPTFNSDLLITDIEMPRMSGFDLCDRVRRSDRWKNLPVIAVTSLAGDADRAHGIQLGVSEYMVKLNRDELIATAARHLGLTVVHE